MFVLSAFLRHHRPSGLTALEINYFLSQIAEGMVTTFGIIYIFRLGGNFIHGLMFVLGFYASQRLLVMLMVPFLPRLIPKIGYRWLIALSLAAELVKIILFVLTKSMSVWFLVPAAICGGFYLAAYDLGFHGLFLADNDNDKVGEQIGLFDILQSLGLVITPLFVGILIDKVGFSVMFGLSATVLFLSIVPLLLMHKHKHPKHNYNVNRVVNLISTEPEFTGSLAFWYLTASITDFFWPIYLMTFNLGFAFLGGVKSLVMLGASLSVLGFGKVYDHRPLRRIFKVGTVMQAGVWIFRFLVVSPVGLAITDLAGKVMSPVWWMKIRRYELELGEREEATVFAVAHVLIMSGGMIGGLVMGVWLLAMTQGNWLVLAIPSVLGVLVSGYLVIKD
jgi:hypothetical protein